MIASRVVKRFAAGAGLLAGVDSLVLRKSSTTAPAHQNEEEASTAKLRLLLRSRKWQAEHQKQLGLEADDVAFFSRIYNQLHEPSAGAVKVTTTQWLKRVLGELDSYSIDSSVFALAQGRYKPRKKYVEGLVNWASGLGSAAASLGRTALKVTAEAPLVLAGMEQGPQATLKDFGYQLAASWHGKHMPDATKPELFFKPYSENATVEQIVFGGPGGGNTTGMDMETGETEPQKTLEESGDDQIEAKKLDYYRAWADSLRAYRDEKSIAALVQKKKSASASASTIRHLFIGLEKAARYTGHLQQLSLQFEKSPLGKVPGLHAAVKRWLFGRELSKSEQETMAKEKLAKEQRTRAKIMQMDSDIDRRVEEHQRRVLAAGQRVDIAAGDESNDFLELNDDAHKPSSSSTTPPSEQPEPPATQDSVPAAAGRSTETVGDAGAKQEEIELAKMIVMHPQWYFYVDSRTRKATFAFRGTMGGFLDDWMVNISVEGDHSSPVHTHYTQSPKWNAQRGCSGGTKSNQSQTESSSTAKRVDKEEKDDACEEGNKQHSASKWRKMKRWCQGKKRPRVGSTPSRMTGRVSSYVKLHNGFYKRAAVSLADFELQLRKACKCGALANVDWLAGLQDRFVSSSPTHDEPETALSRPYFFGPAPLPRRASVGDGGPRLEVFDEALSERLDPYEAFYDDSVREEVIFQKNRKIEPPAFVHYLQNCVGRDFDEVVLTGHSLGGATAMVVHRLREESALLRTLLAKPKKQLQRTRDHDKKSEVATAGPGAASCPRVVEKYSPDGGRKWAAWRSRRLPAGVGGKVDGAPEDLPNLAANEVEKEVEEQEEATSAAAPSFATSSSGGAAPPHASASRSGTRTGDNVNAENSADKEKQEQETIPSSSASAEKLKLLAHESENIEDDGEGEQTEVRVEDVGTMDMKPVQTITFSAPPIFSAESIASAAQAQRYLITGKIPWSVWRGVKRRREYDFTEQHKMRRTVNIWLNNDLVPRFAHLAIMQQPLLVQPVEKLLWLREETFRVAKNKNERDKQEEGPADAGENKREDEQARLDNRHRKQESLQQVEVQAGGSALVTNGTEKDTARHLGDGAALRGKLELEAGEQHELQVYRTVLPVSAKAYYLYLSHFDTTLGLGKDLGSTVKAHLPHALTPFLEHLFGRARRGNPMSPDQGLAGAPSDHVGEFSTLSMNGPILVSPREFLRLEKASCRIEKRSMKNLVVAAAGLGLAGAGLAAGGTPAAIARGAGKALLFG